MIVYIESNFILELAFLREEHENCQTLLDFAEAHILSLVMPAFSIGEPYEVWVRRSKQRRDLHTRLNNEIQELARSKPYKEVQQEFQKLTDLLLRSGEEEKRRLDMTLDAVLKTAEVIPININTIQAAITSQKTLDLSPQDSIVYASIIEHLRGASTGDTRCFVTKNSKDFVNPDIVNELALYSCKLLVRFKAGLDYARNYQ